VRPEQLKHLAGAGAAVIGRSHRRKPVRQSVGEIGHSLRERALHLAYGEFSSKFAACTGGAPFPRDPIVIEAERGDAPSPHPLVDGDNSDADSDGAKAVRPAL
jgi:phosphoserine aminotransferase